MQHYLVFIYGDVEPELLGPFLTPEVRDQQAKQLRADEGDEHGIYMLDIDHDRQTAEMSAYPGGFFDDPDGIGEPD